jgi:aldehyde:ferredoxin oxidoreductase
MLNEYYSLHHWDPKTSFPKKQTLRALSLGKYIDILEKKGKIV